MKKMKNSFQFRFFTKRDFGQTLGQSDTLDNKGFLKIPWALFEIVNRQNVSF